jgi:hypothetical protein
MSGFNQSALRKIRHRNFDFRGASGLARIMASTASAAFLAALSHSSLGFSQKVVAEPLAQRKFGDFSGRRGGQFVHEDNIVGHPPFGDA